MSFYRTKMVKTRSGHACWGCKKQIQVGTNTRRDTGAGPDGIISTYWCDTCSTVLDDLESWEIEDGLFMGELVNHPNYPKATP